MTQFIVEVRLEKAGMWLIWAVYDDQESAEKLVRSAEKMPSIHERKWKAVRIRKTETEIIYQAGSF